MGFTSFILVIIFVSWLAFERSKVSRHEKKRSDDFWRNENLANSIRKKDISQLEYLHIPIDVLPFINSNDEILTRCQNDIKYLSTQKILNLTGISNTNLKLEYGVGNLNFLTEADQNFTNLSRIIVLWGSRLNELDRTLDAITVLEFGVSCKSDVSTNYTLLADLYRKTLQSDKISYLIESAQELNSLSKKSIIKKLNAIN